ncbi:MAG: DUF4834 family protein [Bacteroidetes bacterium]|nr:DUF4834 family protein [Bacteroidota bacterium]
MQNLIYEASLTGVFRMVFIIFIIYVAITFVFRHIIPHLFRNYLQNFHEHNFNRESYSNNSQKKKEGYVSVEFIEQNKQQSHSGNEDEYVDYEEIK